MLRKLIFLTSILFLVLSCGSDEDSKNTNVYSQAENEKDRATLSVRYMDIHTGIERSTTQIVEGMKYSLLIHGEKCSSIEAYQKSSDGSYYQLTNQQSDPNYACRSYPFVFTPYGNSVIVSARVDGKRLTKELKISVKSINQYEVMKYY